MEPLFSSPELQISVQAEGRLVNGRFALVPGTENWEDSWTAGAIPPQGWLLEAERLSCLGDSTVPRPTRGTVALGKTQDVQ